MMPRWYNTNIVGYMCEIYDSILKKFLKILKFLSRLEVSLSHEPTLTQKYFTNYAAAKTFTCTHIAIFTNQL